MKIFKNIILIIILSFSTIYTVNAQSSNYKNVYIDYLKNYNIDKQYPEKALFYDLNNDNIPEMILQRFEALGNEKNGEYNTICDIYTIKNNELEKIHTIKNKTKYIFRDHAMLNTIVFFTTSNNKNLYYGLQDFDVNYNMSYYKLNYDNNKITSTLIGKTETKFFEDFTLRQLNLNSDKYYYNNKQVSKNEFLNSLRFKQTLNTISLKNIDDIEKSLNNYNNIPANPTYIFNVRPYEIQNKYGSVDANHIIYNSGLYDYFKDNIHLLMINGNIIPKANVIIENDKIYLPLRTICNYINKEIAYNNKNNSITIDNITIGLKDGKTSKGEKFHIKNIEGVTYLPSEFFDKYLNFNVYNAKVNEGETSNTVDNKPLKYNINIVNLEDKSLNINYAPIKPLKEEINNLKFEDITTFIVSSVSEPTILGRYYVFKAKLETPNGIFNFYRYFIYDNYSNIKYW